MNQAKKKKIKIKVVVQMMTMMLLITTTTMTAIDDMTVCILNRDYHLIAQLCREKSHKLLMLFYLLVDQTATRTHVSGCYIFLCSHSKYIFYVKKSIFFFNSKFLKHILIVLIAK